MSFAELGQRVMAWKVYFRMQNLGMSVAREIERESDWQEGD